MKKFNLKLTLAAVSLFIAVVLAAFAGRSLRFVGLACFLMAVACVFVALDRTDKTRDTIRLTDEDMATETDEDIIYQVSLEKKKYLKRSKRTRFSLYLCAVLLVIVGIIALI